MNETREYVACSHGKVRWEQKEDMSLVSIGGAQIPPHKSSTQVRGMRTAMVKVVRKAGLNPKP